jgi:type II restriction/modification system DNA methylase subunit YeeA
VNASDLAGRSSDTWIIDFGPAMTEAEAALYQVPFEYILKHVKPVRNQVRRQNHRINWWRHGEARPGMRRALTGLRRFLVTPRVSKHRFFVWLHTEILPDSRLVVIARDDEITFGILQSRFHEIWTLRLGGRHGVGNDPQYTPTLGFETFPFPKGLTPNIPAIDCAADPRAVEITKAGKRLDALRNAWLNPADLVLIEPEIVPGCPDRIVPKDTIAAAKLRERTLTNLYNQSPQWLTKAHRDLDIAVAAAYGWSADISDEDALTELLLLNLTRADAHDKRGDEAHHGDKI